MTLRNFFHCLFYGGPLIIIDWEHGIAITLRLEQRMVITSLRNLSVSVNRGLIADNVADMVDQLLIEYESKVSQQARHLCN